MPGDFIAMSKTTHLICCALSLTRAHTQACGRVLFPPISHSRMHSLTHSLTQSREREGWSSPLSVEKKGGRVRKYAGARSRCLSLPHLQTIKLTT
mmetsp:Transcript_7014/g.6192  ORF Transcript_7014/g.6192 Transcript_7014/m.6192 type:complete len:95 (-) Transcript_7014:18-302(-)